eukprot:XP_765233.1 4-hydroxy-3-methylbut-2-en-1-yl diphosphate synthase [Theileria parva strain Muguga]
MYIVLVLLLVNSTTEGVRIYSNKIDSKDGLTRPFGRNFTFIANFNPKKRDSRLFEKKEEDGDKTYCENVYKRERFPTRCVKIGKVTIGGNHPIAIQTMTSCDTNDVQQTVDQILKVQEYGSDMVRITVQSPREVKSSELIKEKLNSLNCDIPLIADTHFNAKVAMLCADIFDKVRVNPGNYVIGRKNWDMKVYNTEEEFKKSGEYIEEVFTPLVLKCKELKKAIRIGTNHGSLSSRVMSYYGDTPLGMVMSAIEFAEICRKNDFHNFVFSLKSSNIFVMIHAYRLLVNIMKKRGWDYPIHLGVTEAGSVDDGRIKSCLGIGSLLIDGIGDTIRMSLTEDPWFELIPCRKLLESVQKLYPGTKIIDTDHMNERDNVGEKLIPDKSFNYDDWRDFRSIERREVNYGKSILNYEDSNKNNLLNPNGSVGTVLHSHHLNNRVELYKSLGLDIVNGLPSRSLKSVDFVFLEDVPYFHEYNKQRLIKELIEGGINVVLPLRKLKYNPIKFAIGLVTVDEYNLLTRSTPKRYHNDNRSTNHPDSRLMGIDLNNEVPGQPILEDRDVVDELNKLEKLVVKITGNETDDQLLDLFNTHQRNETLNLNNKDRNNQIGFIILDIDPKLNYMYTVRRIFGLLNKTKCDLPVIHQLNFPSLENQQDMLVDSCCLLGCNLIDKMGEGIIIKSKLPIDITNKLSLDILQNSRMRNIKTDFISCPSCGRTLFNIQETTEEVRRRIGHLPGVTIAIMGCIVNGIGEMADADFGYVGGSPGKVDLYVKKQLIERNIPKDQACDKLIELIKKHNKWVEPP